MDESQPAERTPEPLWAQRAPHVQDATQELTRVRPHAVLRQQLASLRSEQAPAATAAVEPPARPKRDATQEQTAS